MARKKSWLGDLQPPTRVWVKAVLAEFVLEEHHRRLLLMAAEAWDRVQEARGYIKAEGPYLEDRFGQLKAHPAIAVERDARIAFARLLRELALDVEPPGTSENQRVPRLNSRGPLQLSS